MTVFVVIRCTGSGEIAGVFSSRDKAITYVQEHPFIGYVIIEHTLDGLSITQVV